MACLSSRQINEWMAYADIEPFGSKVADEQLANVAAMFASGMLKKSDGSEFSIADFMLHPPPKPEPVQKTPEELAAAIKARIFGAKD